MKPPMRFTIYKVTTSRNAYGDYVASGETPLQAHVRVINSFNLNGINEEALSDAMIWVESNSGVEKEDLIKIEDTYYRVDKVTEARKLRSNTIQFLKCELNKYGMIS